MLIKGKMMEMFTFFPKTLRYDLLLAGSKSRQKSLFSFFSPSEQYHVFSYIIFLIVAPYPTLRLWDFGAICSDYGSRWWSNGSKPIRGEHPAEL